MKKNYDNVKRIPRSRIADPPPMKIHDAEVTAIVMTKDPPFGEWVKIVEPCEVKNLSGYQKLKNQIRILERDALIAQAEIMALVMDPDGPESTITKARVELIHNISQDLDRMIWAGESSDPTS